MESKVMRKINYWHWFSSVICVGVVGFFTQDVFASTTLTAGGMASQITRSFGSVGGVINPLINGAGQKIN